MYKLKALYWYLFAALLVGIAVLPTRQTVSASGTVGNDASGNRACTSGLLYERWNDIPGNFVGDLVAVDAYPNSPDFVTTITDFTIDPDTGGDFGLRLRGHIVAPASGNYQFWIASDDHASLMLSSDGSAENATEIAKVTNFVEPGAYDTNPEQASAIISLTAGQSYYVEVLFKEYYGGDHLAVAWTTPSSSTRALITGANLCKLEMTGYPPTAAFSSFPATGPAPFTTFLDAADATDFDGDIVSYEWSTSDGAVGTGATFSTTFPYAGSKSVTLKVTDNDGNVTTRTQPYAVTNPAASCDTGLLHEWWDDIPGTRVVDLTRNHLYPNHASGSETLFNGFKTSSDLGGEFGRRVRGYIKAPETGTYNFYIASDDQSELWLSTNEDPDNATMVAYVPAWTSPEEYTKFSSQQASGISMVAGQKYYVEALMKEAWGGDHLSVAWTVPQFPGSIFTIGSQDVCTFSTNGATPEGSISADVTSGIAPLTVNFDGTASFDLDGSITDYTWHMGDGSTRSGQTATHTFNFPGAFDVRLVLTDDDGQTSTEIVTINVDANDNICSSHGMLHEWWDGIGGTAIEDLTGSFDYPDNPSGNAIITSFETSGNSSDNYGERVRGFIIPPVSGNYEFRMASDDNGQLWLSSNNEPANAQLIASVSAWVPGAAYDWFGEQLSEQISLTAGEVYYIEALMKESHGNDHLAVQWKMPGGLWQTIPSAVMCAWEENGTLPTADANASTGGRSTDAAYISGIAPLTVNFDGSNSTDAEGAIANWDWDFGDGATGTGAVTSHAYTSGGVFKAKLTVTDVSGRKNTDTILIDVHNPAGSVSCEEHGALREVWMDIYEPGIAGMQASQLYPDRPTGTEMLNTFRVPSNSGELYGSRMRAYLSVPESGNYTFWIANNTEGQFFLSSDADPANASMILESGWTPEGNWDFSAHQQSAPIYLEAGRMYFVEGLHKAEFGNDYYAIAWQGPSGSREIIPSDALCSFNNPGGSATARWSISRAVSAFDAQLGTTTLGQEMPLTLRLELIDLLNQDNALRDEAIALEQQFEAMYLNGDIITGAYIDDVNALYEAIKASASEDLIAWLDSTMNIVYPDQYDGDTATTTWSRLVQLAPTLIALSQIGMSVQPTSSVVILAGSLVLLLLLSGTALRMNRRKGIL